MSKKLTTSAALGTLIASSVGLINAAPAFAVADYTVTNCNADGAGSLLGGVTQLNAAAGGTIDFSNSLGCSTISIASFMGISQDITIIGPTASTLTIKNQSNGRFFAASGTGDLTVSNLTFDGEETYQLISMWDSGATGFSATFDNVHVNNLANDFAIQVNGGEVTITNSHFTDDNSLRASGFIQAPVINVSNSEFIGNGFGEGSLLGAQNTLTVTDSKFDNNDVTYNGGALFSAPNATLTNLVVFNTNASVITETGNQLDLVGSSITNNTTEGPIFQGYQGAIAVSNNTIAENAYGVGQAIFSAANTVATFNTFVNNEEAQQQIGGVVQGSITLGGNIFASDEGYSFRCYNTATGTDLGGNLFTSQPENCGIATLPTTAANGASAVVTWDALKLTPGTPLASGEKFWAAGTGSPARDYITSLSDTDYNATVDQIGTARPLGAKRDAGSIEAAIAAACVPVAKSFVNFAPYSAKLSNAAKKKLRTYASALKASGCTRIKINGYTATINKGSAAGNAYRLNLSKKRALAVKNYLQSQFTRLGIQVTVTRTAYGASSPKKSNNTSAGRAANRRVEIVVVQPV
jgi:outer membrane protein OmpA-like peptidoglycan-associated protein